jgi:hypothetical protein
MSQHYSDAKRESDPHALPDVETFYHDPTDPDRVGNGDPEDELEEGWYWWACFPGCLPDSDPVGPFATEDEALQDARMNDDYCEHDSDE